MGGLCGDYDDYGDDCYDDDEAEPAAAQKVEDNKKGLFDVNADHFGDF